MGRKPILPQGANAFTAGAQLRQLRLNSNISLKDMAEKLTYSKGYLSAVENGKERVHKELLERYETALEIEKGELSGLLQVQRSTSLSDTIEYLVKNASVWSTALEKISIRKEKVKLSMKKGDYRQLSHQTDEKDWQYHLELALINAAEQGLIACKTFEDRDHYRNLLAILSEPGSLSDEIRLSALHQFISTDVPDLEALNKACNLFLNIHLLEKSTVEVDMKPHINSFMNALIAHVFTDPFFKPQIDNLVGMSFATNAYRKPIDIIVTLNQVYDTLPDHYSPEQFGRDVVTYTEYVESRLRHLKLVGIVPKDKNSDPELNDTFVPLRVTLQDQSQSLFETSGDASLVALLEQYSYVVLLGGPGSGKSTSARHLAWSHALANLSNPHNTSFPILLGNPLPLRIELRSLSENRRDHHEYDFLSYALEVILRGEDVKINPQMFQTLLNRGAMLLIFDGLDEVATLDERKQLVQEIELFALKYPGNRILVTSRPVGYELAPCSRHQFKHALVQDFNDEQIQQFLHNWYAYVLKQTFLSQDDRIEIDKLSDILHNDKRLRKLAENPLLLTVITALHRYERLPDKRVLVYDRCADLLLNTWARLKGTDARWKDLKMTKDDQYACVAHLGHVLHQQSQENRDEFIAKKVDSLNEGASDVPSLFLLKEIERFLRERKLITGVDEQRAEAKRFLDLMQEEAGLVVVRGTDRKGDALYGFVHRTFQEYFAAAYFYEQFQQEVDISVISTFLKEHLHDPHWHEVILLLLGKLKPKPVTILLNSILSGKIESHRSSYSNILKQDLLFVSSCMAEEIEVQYELVEKVISHLIDLVKSAPFPLQRSESLEKLYLLIQTRQYASNALDELIILVRQRPSLDIDIKLKIALILFDSNFSAKNTQVAVEILEHLAQNPDPVVSQALKKMIRESHSWLKESKSVFELLRHLIRCTNLSTMLTIDVALELYQLSPTKSQEKQQTAQLILQLAQHHDLPIEQAIQSLTLLYRVSPKESQEKQQTAQLILQLAQHHDLPIEQAIQSLTLLYRVSPKESQDEQFIAKFINYLALRLDMSSIKEVLKLLGSRSPATRLPISKEFSETRQIIKNLFVSFAQRSDIPVEDTIQDIENLYRDFSKTSVERNIVAQMLSSLANRADLSVEQAIQVVEVFNEPTMQSPSEKRLRNQQLLELSQRPDLSVEQAIWIAHTLAPVLLDRYAKNDPLEINKIAEVLASFARSPDLSAEEAIQIAQALLQFREDEFGLALSIPLLFQVAQDQMLTLKQRLEAIKALFEVKIITWREVAQMVQIVLSLFNEEEAKKYLNEYWPNTVRWPIQSDEEVMLSVAPCLAELAQQELLPTRARNKAYSTLRSLVPKFDRLVLGKVR